MAPREPIERLANAWIQQDRDDATRREIQHLLQTGDEAELDDRLRKRIGFGTAGLRAAMKAGFAYMNPLTVLQASEGLSQYIIDQQRLSAQPDQRLSIVVGYDARHQSERFARLAAGVFLAKGLHVLWFGRLVHTPMVSFAVSHYRAAAGVMVTASHNPKNDNGYKVYWSNGSQIIPPHDVGIARCIGEVGTIPTWDETSVDSHTRSQDIFAPATEAYMDTLRELSGPLASVEPAMPFTYTPLHGVGLPFMQQVAHALGFRGNTMHVVSAQAQPDPEFPTVRFPNPEERGALDLAIREAEANGTTVVIANDPDADRFSIAERIDGTTWHQFTGNQIGILLASYILESYGGERRKLTMLASTVSSRMLEAMAKKEGFHFRETLTGFKWLGNVAQDLRRAGFDVAFAYEEAIGYMFPGVVWDKDGIAAAAVFLMARRRWAEQGVTPWQKLRRLYQTYGYFADANTYLVSPTPEATARVFADIRRANDGAAPTAVGARRILRWRDLTVGYDSAGQQGTPDLPADPTAQMITCELEGVTFTARGSGTEPKIKLYIEGTAESAAEAQSRADQVLSDLLREWFKPEYGLRLAGT